MQSHRKSWAAARAPETDKDMPIDANQGPKLSLNWTRMSTCAFQRYCFTSLGGRPSQVGWRRLLLGCLALKRSRTCLKRAQLIFRINSGCALLHSTSQRIVLLGWRPSLVGWRPLLLATTNKQKKERPNCSNCSSDAVRSHGQSKVREEGALES